MGKIIGIDYGRKKIGLAVSEGFLADPLKVLKIGDFDGAVREVVKTVVAEGVDKVIVGISEGEMGKESEKFAGVLRESLSVPVHTFDETLTTSEAQRLSIQAGIKRAKRKALEDAFAAAVMLQSYLDTYV